MTELEKLIAENRWRDIAEAPREHQLYILGHDFDVGVYNMHWREDKECWVYSWNQEPCNPIEWKSFPDNRLADICQVLMDGLQEIINNHAGCLCDERIALAAFEKVEEIAKGEK